MKKVFIASLIVLPLVSVNVGLGYMLYQKITASNTMTYQNVQSEPPNVAAVQSTQNDSVSTNPIPGSLGVNVSDFKTKFNNIVTRNNRNKLLINDLSIYHGSVQDSASYLFNGDLGLMLTVNKADQTIRDISLFYQRDSISAGIDFLLAVGIIVEITNPELPADRRKEVLQDFGYLDNITSSSMKDILKYSIKNKVVYQLMDGAGIDGNQFLFNASSIQDVENIDIKEKSTNTDKAQPLENKENVEFLNKLKKSSRYQFPLKDRSGSAYDLFVLPVRESKQITTKSNNYAGANEGDVIYKGKYDLALVKKGDSFITDQIPFYTKAEEDLFNMNRKTSYVVSAPTEKKPDVLVISQYATSSAQQVFLYLIDEGKIQNLSILSRDKNSSDSLIISSKLKGIGNDRYESSSYNNADGLTYVSTFRLDLGKKQFIQESIRSLQGVQSDNK